MNFTMKKVISSISLSPFLFLFNLRNHILRILPPFVYQRLHVLRKAGIKPYELSCAGMHKPEGLGMQGLARQKPEAVGDELAVLGIDCPFAYLRAVIARVIEQGMPDIIEMDTYLMRTSRLQAAFHNGNITEALQHAEMSHGMLSMVAFRKDLEPHAVIWVTPYVAGYRALVLPYVAPYNSHITAFD